MRVKSAFFIPSIADILFVSLFFDLSFSAGKGLLADGDTGYHIRAGEIIVDTLSVPKYDMFSFLSPPLPWTAHEWLSEVIMALVHRASGLTGIVIFFAFLISSVYYLMFKILQTHNGNIFATVFIVLLVVASSQLHWLARPHVFSLFFMVIWYYLLDLYQYEDKNYLYWLPPLMLFWVNLHAGFMVGFILLGVYLFGNLVRIIFSVSDSGEVWKQKATILGLITSSCVIISLINPNGYHILTYPLNLTSSKFLMDNVQEFQSPNFHEFMPYTCLLFLTLAVIAFSGKALNTIEICLVLGFTYMSLYSVRYIPLFGIVVAPILLKQINAILENKTGRFMDFLRKRANNIAQVDRSAKGLLWSIIALSVVVLFVVKGRVEYGFDKEKKAVNAAEFLKKEHLSGNMFNNEEFGDYIIYSAYPQYKVFFDGRNDMYGPGRLKEYSDVIFLKPGWEKILEKYEIKWIIFNTDSTFSTFLLANNGWRLIYSDKVANIFVKNIPENKYLIDKYGGPRAVIVKD
jgi:hypothetical protein